MTVVVSAVTAVAAVFTAEVVTAAIIFEGIAGAGALMTATGLVTGNKTLMKYGGELGLVGGIGAFAAGAFSAGAAEAGVAGAAEGAANAAGGEAAQAAAQGAEGSLLSPVAGVAPTAGSFAPDAASFGGDISATGATTYPVSMPPSGAAVAPTVPVVPAEAGQLASAPGPAAVAAPGGAAAPATPFEDGFIGTDAAIGAAPPKELWDTIKDKFGAGWDKMGANGKAEILKSILAVPGGIQAQKNKAAELAIAQQNVDINKQRTTQTSFGNSMPTFGIINQARGG